MSETPTMNSPKTWPTDQHYWCNCHICGTAYFGPKFAPACWECVSEDTRKWWNERWERNRQTEAEVEAMLKEAGFKI